MGRCPECGSYYNVVTGDGIKPPESALSKAERLKNRIRTIALAVAAGFIAICSGVAFIIFDRVQWLAVGGFIMLMLILGAVTSYVYEKEEQ